MRINAKLGNYLQLSFYKKNTQLFIALTKQFKLKTVQFKAQRWI